MQWYSDRLGELKEVTPIYSCCGDDCAVCPRYLAKTEEELHATAEFWYQVGWRDHVVTNEEIRCTGCGCRGTCSFMILPCQKEKGVEECRKCEQYVCDKMNRMFELSDQKEMQCRKACGNDEMFAMLKRAFYEKKQNIFGEH